MSHTPKKSLGQNFLHDMHVVQKIIAAGQLHSDDVVIEVGPGEGVLTRELCKNAGHVVAIEIDQNLIPLLKEKFKDVDNLTIIHGDIRRLHLVDILQNTFGKTRDYKVVANLPYYITSSIIRFFLESDVPPTDMVIMVQKEVAERITAQPGALGILAIAVQYYGTPHYLFTVPKESFDPVPKVESAVVHISYTAEKGIANDATQEFFRVVKTGFSARRKTLANNLANGFHKDKASIENILTECELAHTVRAQELSLVQWHAIVIALRNDAAK